MLPEAKLIKEERTIRVLHIGEEVKLSKQSSIRYIALSLGLISPKETRTGFLEVFEALMDSFMEGKGIVIKELTEKLEKKGIDEKTIYYHVKRLQNLGIVKKREGEYFIGDGFEKDFVKIVEESYKKTMDEMLNNIKEVYTSLKHR